VKRTAHLDLDARPLKETKKEVKRVEEPRKRVLPRFVEIPASLRNR